MCHIPCLQNCCSKNGGLNCKQTSLLLAGYMTLQSLVTRVVQESLTFPASLYLLLNQCLNEVLNTWRCPLRKRHSINIVKPAYSKNVTEFDFRNVQNTTPFWSLEMK